MVIRKGTESADSSSNVHPQRVRETERESVKLISNFRYVTLYNASLEKDCLYDIIGVIIKKPEITRNAGGKE